MSLKIISSPKHFKLVCPAIFHPERILNSLGLIPATVPTRYVRQVFQGNRSQRRQGSRMRLEDSNATPTLNSPTWRLLQPQSTSEIRCPPSERTRAARSQQQLTRGCTRAAPNSLPFTDHLLLAVRPCTSS